MRLSLILVFLQLWGNVKVSFSQNACSVVPVVPHAHVQEEFIKAEYHEGHVVHFTCETGYISGPTIRYVCTNTGWLELRQGKCYLKPCELPDDTPNGYYQIAHGEDFVFGATIQYFCNDGYYMVSKVDTRTCLLNGWNNHVPICQPFSCDPPPEDDEITIKGLSRTEDPIRPDHFLTFSCDHPGKYLNGSSTLICGKDGQWDHPFPTCEDITCKVDIVDPRLSAAELTPANKMVNVGHKLTFYCNDDFTLDGPEEIQCLPTGHWSDRFPVCTDRCLVTNPPDNVNIINHRPGNKLTKGQKLKFYCRLRSHVLKGNSTVECLANGQWSYPFPTCGPPVGCGKPPHLEDGDTKGTTRYKYNHGERVEYTCQNYYIMEGGPFKTCNNGEWTGAIRCIRPCTVDREAMNRHNIIFKYTRQDKLYATHNDEIEFLCKSGRHQVGTVEMRQRCIDGVMHLPSCQ